MELKRFNEANRDDIERYVAGGGKESGIALTELQLKLVDRWRYADEKIRQNKYNREQISLFIQGKFDVCRDTAYRDIVNAEHVFSSSCPLNKRYFTQRRIELLESKINECYVRLMFMEAAMLEKILQKYVEKYPDTTIRQSPKTIIYNITKNDFTVNAMTVADAYLQADIVLKQIEHNDDY